MLKEGRQIAAAVLSQKDIDTLKQGVYQFGNCPFGYAVLRGWGVRAERDSETTGRRLPVGGFMAGDATSRGKRIVVLLVARNPLARKYLEGVLARDRAVRLLPEGTLRRGFERPKLPGVIVAAFGQAPGTPGSLGALRRGAPDARILVVGPKLARRGIFNLIEAGAHGFVDIEKVEADLLPAVPSLSEGRAWRRLEDFAVAARVAGSRTAGSVPVFTPREAGVVALVRQGLLNKQVASELGIAERTVKFHLRNIFVKLGISDRRLIADSVFAAAAPQGTARQPAGAPQATGRTSARR